tara:strand:+ start:445 stop:645 length:201 start_codon:yes stop_codon:yes gene_type:complete
MKLYIKDEGDPSVGIFPQTYTVETPFTGGHEDKDDMEWFKSRMLDTYREFSEGSLILWYENESCIG